MDFISLIMGAVVVEGLVSYTKLFFVEGKVQWQVLTALVLGILVAVTYQIDLFKIAGMTAVIPYVGIILTGILISRGSNYIYDLIKILKDLVQIKSAKINDD